MPRNPRFFEEGYVYHVIQRGNNKCKIFRDHADYLVFLKYLREGKQEYPCHLYGYCLMENHLHLLMEPIQGNHISLLMKKVTGNYARYINKKYNRTGVLYEGRFKAAIIQYEKYFFDCLRYVELNPVRSGLVKNPEQYPWSSYNFHTRAEPTSILDYDRLYLSLGNGIQECRFRYKEFVTEKIEQDSVLKMIREQTNKSGAIGKVGPGTAFYPQSYSQKAVPGTNF